MRPGTRKERRDDPPFCSPSPPMTAAPCPRRAWTPLPIPSPTTCGWQWTPQGGRPSVWEDSTAVPRRVLLRYTTGGGRPWSPAQVLAQAIRAYAPDIAASPAGRVVVVWHGEQFPLTKTALQTIHSGDTGQKEGSTTTGVSIPDE
jgi:hypothetical protein